MCQSLAVCIVVNGEKFQSQCDLDLDWTVQIFNSSELFSFTAICPSLKLIDPLFFWNILFFKGFKIKCSYLQYASDVT